MTSPAHDDTNEKLDPTLLAPSDKTLSRMDSREKSNRLQDDLELARIERQVSNEERLEKENASRAGRRSVSHNRHDRHHPMAEPEDAFHTLTEPDPLPVAKSEPEPTFLANLFKKLRKFPRVARYFLYAIPIAIILLTPILLDLYAFPDTDNPVGGPGGVKLVWFGIWLEIVWCSLWASRVIAAGLPRLFGLGAKLVGSTNNKKWRDIGRQMEMSTGLFIWMLGMICSFKPIMNNHRSSSGDWSDGTPDISWINVVWKIIIAVFVLAACNFVEKIVIQWIATSFHVRTYSTRIEQNKAEIDMLVQLYAYSKEKLALDDPVWGDPNAQGGSTPLRMVQNNVRQAWTQVGKVAGKVAGDFTGRKYMAAGHPRKVVLELLRNQSGSHTLARLIYRTFHRPDEETIMLEDLRDAFPSVEDAEACFGIFDKDLNGDISMEELELVCNEIHLEKKAIAASLKDLDSVVKKLDAVFLVIIAIIAIIVFVSIISGSAASALGTSGTTILGLSWLLQASAEEFLQSIIFVFIKHPFDVGDRITVYGNTGSLGTGDDYFVQEISLLYTEFKKMEGHIVQAPNSLLNTLFILNQRRSSGISDVIELKMRFGTPSDLIEELKGRMLDFVLQNKRDYKPNILSEVRTLDEVYSVTMNIIFFHKSNYQNELQRLQRHNKFATELMRVMYELGIEGPRKMQPGGERSFPFYLAYPPSYSESAQHGVPTAPGAPGVPGVPTGVPSSAPAGPAAQQQQQQQQQQQPHTPHDYHGAHALHSVRDAHRDYTSRERDRSRDNGSILSNDVRAPSPETRRRRAESAAREAPMPGDVFDGRRDTAAAHAARLQILREEAAASHLGVTTGADRVSERGVGSPVGRRGSNDSHSTTAARHGMGLFRRPRSVSRTIRSDAGASMV
ncbi:hypothetical protein SLS53_005079 [Cytospora paraplurivora]|uniref:Mechanosensitive ion channel protein n=1 Tax=Cytospora paraplurivora TaxID=2898453 RepID=A0AAN9U9D1_9PEZI